MAKKFCEECGSRLDETTGLCPNCDKEKLIEIEKRNTHQEDNKVNNTQIKEKNNHIVKNICMIFGIVVTIAFIGIIVFMVGKKVVNDNNSLLNENTVSSEEFAINTYDYQLAIQEFVDLDLTTKENITFRSGDSSIVTVDSGGKLYGISNGETTIVITDNSTSKDYTVNVSVSGLIDSQTASTVTNIASNSNDTTSDDSNVDNNITTTSEYVLPNSSTTILTSSDVENLTKDELRIARNEIYARHGCYFEDEELQAYFESCNWYENKGYKALEYNSLSDIEKKNIELIKSYE